MNQSKVYAKNFLCFIITFAMLFSLIPTSVHAEDETIVEKELTLDPIVLTVGDYFNLYSYGLIDYIADENIKALAEKNWNSAIRIADCSYDTSVLAGGLYYELLTCDSLGVPTSSLYGGINITSDEQALEQTVTTPDGKSITYVEEASACTIRALAPSETTIVAKNVYLEGQDEHAPVYTLNIPVVITSGTLNHQVLFVHENVLLSIQEVESGYSATPPDVACQKGYHIDWNKSYSNITSNLVLTSSTATNKYHVVYKSNGGKGTLSASKNRSYGQSWKLKANTFTKKGYVFSGWNTKADGSGRSYKNKASVKNMAATHNKTITLYAQWKKEKKKN